LIAADRTDRRKLPGVRLLRTLEPPMKYSVSMACVVALASIVQPVQADDYTKASFSGGVFPGDANVVTPFTALVSQGELLGGSFVFDNDLIPAGGTGFVNVLDSNFPDVGGIPAADLFSFGLGALTLTAANIDPGAFLAIQYDNGVFNGFAAQLDFDYLGSSYALTISARTFTVLQLIGGNPEHSVNYVNGYLNIPLTDLTPYTPQVQTGGVPEPAGWVLMVGGFGMIGGRLRRRRTAIRFG
jgi:hypothetical protein